MPRPNTGYRLVLTGRGYEVRWTEPGGHSRRSRTGTKDVGEAQQVLAQFIQGRAGQVAAERGELTVGAILDAYEREHCPTIIEGAKVARFILPRLRDHFGDNTPRQVTVDLCQSYRPAKERGEGMASDGTRRQHLALLRAAFGHAVRTRRMAQQDVPYIPKPAKGDPRSRVLTPDEHRRLLAQADDRLALFLHIAHATAYRKRAILGLTWFQVDLQRGIIDPRTGKEKKKRKAVVPISDELMPILQAAHAKRTTEYVLGHPGRIDKAFRSACDRAELGADVTPHTYRHTVATHMVAAGVSMEEVARVLGDTPQTVRATYAHLDPNYLRSAVNFRRDRRAG